MSFRSCSPLTTFPSDMADEFTRPQRRRLKLIVLSEAVEKIASPHPCRGESSVDVPSRSLHHRSLKRVHGNETGTSMHDHVKTKSLTWSASSGRAGSSPTCWPSLFRLLLSQTPCNLEVATLCVGRAILASWSRAGPPSSWAAGPLS